MSRESSRLLVLIRRGPYGDSLGRAAVDAALAAAAFEQPLDLVFMGDGVLQLVPGQESDGVGRRNLGKLLASLPLYGIETVYAEKTSAERYGLDLEESPVPAHVVDASEIRAMVERCDHLLPF